LLHAYANGAHEARIAGIIGAELPDLSITLGSLVCPEIREYERLSTACANAFVKPLMGRYLRSLASRLAGEGLACPFLLMTSGGGLTTLEAAAEFPVRLVESGPAGGAILAGHLASKLGVDRVVSFDMGGTTAKICLIDDGEPQLSRSFEVDRSYRFKKGSGLPVRIPVIEMVEIGAGGGSIAEVDTLQRIQVGPESAGSEPGPAAYGRGGDRATVTDADVVLGRIDASSFAGGTLSLDAQAAGKVVEKRIAAPLGLSVANGAFGISEIVDENMGAATRAHALEWGKDVAGRTMVAFGGAAPLHAARLARKLGVERVLIPHGAGVGSAIGFLLAPVAYEVVRSRHMLVSRFEPGPINEVMNEMIVEAEAVIVPAVGASVALKETRRAYMRYVGQGYEIAVPLPPGVVKDADREVVIDAFEGAYRELYGRLIPNLDIEVLSWTLTLAAPVAPPPARDADTITERVATSDVIGRLFDGEHFVDAPQFRRETLSAGMHVAGPALIIEDQTTSVILSGFTATVNARGDLELINHG
jgi:N-methylhydantoinase A